MTDSPAFNTRSSSSKKHHHHTKKHHHTTTTASEDPPPEGGASTSTIFHFPFQNYMKSNFISQVPPTALTIPTTNKPVMTWAAPLFTFENLHRYALTMMCPCSALYAIFMDKLVDIHHYHADPHLGYHPTMKEMCCSCVSCLFFPICGNRLVATQENEDKKGNHHIYDYLYYDGEENSEVSSLLQDICTCYPHTEETKSPIVTTTSGMCNNALMILMGCVLTSGCFIPATCIARQITTQKYHPPSIRESYWRSGLVSCFAWPCGLVQVMDEIQWQEQTHHDPNLLLNHQ